MSGSVISLTNWNGNIMSQLTKSKRFLPTRLDIDEFSVVTFVARMFMARLVRPWQVDTCLCSSSENVNEPHW